MTEEEARERFWILHKLVQKTKEARLVFSDERDALAIEEAALRERIEFIIQKREEVMQSTSLGLLENEMSGLSRFLRGRVGEPPEEEV